MDPTNKVRMEEGSPPVDKGRNQGLVGKLIYLSHTRPDICFFVNMVSRFMSGPIEEHLGAIYRILQYLKNSPGKGLFFKKTINIGVELFSNAVWAE